MRQAVMSAPGKIEFRGVPEPTPGPGEILLRVQRIGVCGSDVHVYHGKHPFTSYPVVQGHEFSAIVGAVGEGITNIRPGTKCTLPVHRSFAASVGLVSGGITTSVTC